MVKLVIFILCVLVMVPGCRSERRGGDSTARKTAKAAEPDEQQETVAFRLAGNEPFWNIDISDSGIVFSEPGAEGKLVFPYQAPQMTGERHVFTSGISGEDTHQIEIVVEKQRCIDTMAGTLFEYTATVILDSTTYRGCASAKLTPEETLERYIESLRAGDLSGLQTLLAPETDYPLPASLPVKRYEIIEKEVLTVEEAKMDNIIPPPRAGDLKLTVRQTIARESGEENRTFIYWLTPIGGVWKFYHWTEAEQR